MSEPIATVRLGAKYDAGKPRPALIPGECLLALGEVLAYGAVMKFRGAADPAPFPCALFFFGARPNALQFVKVFDPHGITISCGEGSDEHVQGR